jgi:hypothetical protein
MSEVLGLFVADWAQGLVILAIVGAGWAIVGRLGDAGLVVLVGLVVAQLIWFARAEARRLRRRGRS